jgi:putative membrane protein insertion efficiency factor
MNIFARIILGLIRIYQCTFSTVMGKECRYHPTCSYYTADAVRRFGAARGAWLGIKRILRCHPWRPGGYDPVPETWPDNSCDKHGACDKTS